MSTLRATTSTAAVVDDPSSVQLAALVAEVDNSGRGAFLVLERHSERGTDTVLEAQRDAGTGWQLELRAQEPDGHPAGASYRTELREPALVFATLASWMRGTESWRAQAWQRVSQRTGWSGDGFAAAV